MTKTDGRSSTSGHETDAEKASSAAKCEEYEDCILENPKLLGRGSGFEVNWTVERIVAVVKPKKGSEKGTELEYVVKWKNQLIIEPVARSELLAREPKMLVDFLEKCICYDEEDLE